MRVPLAVLLAVGLVSCNKEPPPPVQTTAVAVPITPIPPSDHAPACARPTEKAAFAVAGLKSQLMVTAISCQANEKYNQFVTRFRPDLVGDEKSLNGYFARAYGRNAQKAHDDYITALANGQSQLGIQAGTDFCRAYMGMFDDVLALKSNADLPTLAATKPIQQALAVDDCSDAPAATKSSASSNKKKKN